MVRPPYVITPLAGIREAVPGHCEVTYNDGKSVDRAVHAARGADAAIIVVGYTHKEEGEYIFLKGGDRDALTLKPHDERLVLRIAAENPRTVVVLVCGSAVITEAWRQKVPAILVAWYPGMEGGNALADVLFGRTNPSGKLPCVFPKSEDQLPFFDKRARSIEYGYFHGYRLLDREGHEPAFPFGFGLSYTTCSYRDLQLDHESIGQEGMLRASVEITNTGNLAGEEVVQLYVGCEGSRLHRPVKELKGFEKVHLAPGEVKRVQFALAASRLAWYDEQARGWHVEPIDYIVYAGPSSRSQELLSARFRINA